MSDESLNETGATDETPTPAAAAGDAEATAAAPVPAAKAGPSAPANGRTTAGPRVALVVLGVLVLLAAGIGAFALVSHWSTKPTPPAPVDSFVGSWRDTSGHTLAITRSGSGTYDLVYATSGQTGSQSAIQATRKGDALEVRNAQDPSAEPAVITVDGDTLNIKFGTTTEKLQRVK
jgi:hypothetical protein